MQLRFHNAILALLARVSRFFWQKSLHRFEGNPNLLGGSSGSMSPTAALPPIHNSATRNWFKRTPPGGVIVLSYAPLLSTSPYLGNPRGLALAAAIGGTIDFMASSNIPRYCIAVTFEICAVSRKFA